MLTAMLQPTSLSASSSTKTKQKLALKPSVVLTSSPTPRASMTAAPTYEQLNANASSFPTPRSPAGSFASSPPISILPVPMKNVSVSSVMLAASVPLNSSPANGALSTPVHLRKTAAGSTAASASSGLASPTKYAGSKFSSSPSPKSLPIPVFSLKGSKTSEDGPDEGLLSAASSLSAASIFSEGPTGRTNTTLSSSLPNISERFPESSSLPASSPNPFLSLRKDLSFPSVSGSSPLAAASTRPETMTLNPSSSTASGPRKSKMYDTSCASSQVPTAKKMSPGRSRPARASAPASATMPPPTALPPATNVPNQVKCNTREASGATPSHQNARRRAKSSFQGPPNTKSSGSKKDNNGRPKTQPNQANASHRPDKVLSSPSSLSPNNAHAVDTPSSLAEISNHLKQLLNIVDGPKA